MPEIHVCIVKDIATIRDVKIENNFQQVKALAKTHEISRLCIYMDAWNCDQCYNGERGQTATEKIHAIAPDIPILIWDGREYFSDENISPVFKVTGKLKPIQYDNELYLSFDYYKNATVTELTKKFFEGSLTVKDIPHRECLDMKRECF